MPIIADSTGRLTGGFTIPAGVPAGAKNVVFDGSGGSHAQTVYFAEGWLQTTVLQAVITSITSFYDPLAQTFTLTEPRIIAALDFKLTAKGSNRNDIRAQIREVALGVPTATVLTEGRINVTSITPVAANTVGSWTRIIFDQPVALLNGREYAIVLLTDDANHAVAVATLGQFAKRTENLREGWVTSQPYQIGVLLSSSNASTWTAHQNSDLCFRLMACRFTATTSTVDFGDIAFINTSDFFVAASVERPDPAAHATFRLTELTGGAVHVAEEYATIQLPAKRSTNVAVECLLEGTPKMSPIVFPEPQVTIGEIEDTGTYIGRAFTAAVDFDASVVFEVLKPGSANCVPTMATQRMASGSPVITGGVYQYDFVAMTKTKSEFTGDGWVEETWTVSGLKGIGLDYQARVKLLLSGTSQFRPYVRNLRALAK